MSSVVISGNTSGSVSLVAPDVAGSSVQTLASVSGTLAPLVSGTAVTASGTTVDFTGIPSWAKRITVMGVGVSGSGTSQQMIQLGDSGGIETTGYLSTGATGGSLNSTGGTIFTTGFGLCPTAIATQVLNFSLVLSIVDPSTNTWMASLSGNISSNTYGIFGGGSKSLSATLDRIRITTVNGTDTFDAGTINIMYE